MARLLKDRGVGPEVRVGLCLERSLDAVAGFLGILKAGGAYLPLDPGYPGERLAYMLEDSGVGVLLTTSALVDELRLPAEWALCLDREAGAESRLPKEAGERVEVSGPHLAYVIYTSGSTGRPKGTLLPHEGLCNLAKYQERVFGITSGTRVLQFASPIYDASVWEMVMALANGGTLCLAPRNRLMPGEDLRELLEERAVNVATITPSVLSALSPEGLSSLRTVIAAGERCGAEIAFRWSRGRRLFNAYGPTESTVCATATPCDPATTGAPPIGPPIDNVQAFILDQDLGLVPPGVPGELYLGGVGLARGYHRRSALTAERFVPDGFGGGAGSRLYKTGDWCRWLPGGSLEFLGRIDHQIKIRGVRVELGEIEAALASYPGMREAVVVAGTDGSGDTTIVAYVVADSDLRPALRRHLSERLPEHMLPSSYVLLDALPRNASGKVDRAALPAPVRSRRALDRPYVAPRNELERTLAEIWSRVLGIERVSIHDSFFELGGHSLSALRLSAEASERLDRPFPLPALFESPTIAGAAARLSRPAASLAASCLVPLRPTGSKPALFFVHGGGGLVMSYVPLMRELDTDQPFLGIQAPEPQGSDGAFGSIEELAALYVEAMRSHQPHGPYRVGGHSFGGVVAFQMAAQLVAEGQQVD
ncbi:MAG TPA: amino acid adenylation domain-containing protein, partial [Vicinamibacteria bacterium]